jgi:hypothetical protein
MPESSRGERGPGSAMPGSQGETGPGVHSKVRPLQQQQHFVHSKHRKYHVSVDSFVWSQLHCHMQFL